MCVKENFHTHISITVTLLLSLSPSPSLSPLSLRWYLTQKKTLEINPHHPLVKELQRRVEKDESDETTVDLARVMFDTAILRSGYTLPDSSSFAGRIERMLQLSVGVDSDAPVSSSHCH